jgi:hypothetical protein
MQDNVLTAATHGKLSNNVTYQVLEATISISIGKAVLESYFSSEPVFFSALNATRPKTINLAAAGQFITL